MVSEKDVFDISGPKHLTSVDWNCPLHRRAVAASLVQGIYVLERDRQQNLSGSMALAPPWWDFFHFELIEQLVDDADLSIFGGIYEYKPFNSVQNAIIGKVPRYVIAFRGTITKGESTPRDLELDLHLVRNGLHQTSRCRIAMQAVQNMVSVAGASNIWLAGHSLGSAFATFVGRNMAKIEVFLESFLFNPPFVSAPIERIKDKNVKLGLRIAGSVITAGLAIAMKGRQQRPRSNDHFISLSSWIPHLFVNPKDHICSEYIGYFEHRQKMEDIGAGNIGRLATQHSLGDLFLGAFGQESDPLHLLPSASLNVNRSHTPDFKWAHGIHQWWKPDLDLHHKQYQYR